MGFWNDGWNENGRTPSPRRSSNNHSHSHSRGHESRPPHNRDQSSSFYSLGNSKGYESRPTNRSQSSFFSVGSTSRGYGSSSRARPRSGLVAKMRRFLRKLYDYMRQHPVKVFMLVIMPLLTGGALTKILSRLGVRLPSSLANMVGGGGGGTDGRYYSHGGARDFGGGSSLPGMGGGVGNSVQGVMKLASMFM